MFSSPKVHAYQNKLLFIHSQEIKKALRLYMFLWEQVSRVELWGGGEEDVFIFLSIFVKNTSDYLTKFTDFIVCLFALFSSSIYIQFLYLWSCQFFHRISSLLVMLILLFSWSSHNRKLVIAIKNCLLSILLRCKIVKIVFSVLRIGELSTKYQNEVYPATSNSEDSNITVHLQWTGQLALNPNLAKLPQVRSEANKFVFKILDWR